MTILSVAYPFAPVSPETAGGAEQVLLTLDHALVRRGHRSLVLACSGSQVAGEYVSFPLPEGSHDAAARERVSATVQAALDRVVETQAVDLVHLHGLDFHCYKLPAELPAVVTLHMPLDWYPGEMWRALPAKTRLVCVSETQLASAPAALLSREQALLVIGNGVELGEETSDGESPDGGTSDAAPEPYALVLGRVCPEKNFHAALDAGSAAGLPVWIGGQVFAYAEHQAYFDQEIVPRLNASDHRFLGPLGPARKRELLAGARCLLVPSLAPETSSLVAMEALAAGTPVIAYRSGALPEIVEDWVTGFLVDGTLAMAAAIARVRQIDRARCRAAAERRFSQTRMVAGYDALYQQSLARP